MRVVRALRRWIGWTAIACLAGTAQAATWQSVSTANNGVVAYVDTSSAQIIDGLVQIWVKYDLSKDRTIKARTLIMRHEINCPDHLIRALSGTFYAPDHKLLANVDYSDKPLHPAVPESIDEALVNAICSSLPKQ